MKYRTVNGKIRHAVGPVGKPIEGVEKRCDDEALCPCGYVVCSQTGPCEPKPVPVKAPLHYHVFSADVNEAFVAETERQFPPGWLWRSLMCYEPDQAEEPKKEEPECK